MRTLRIIGCVAAAAVLATLAYNYGDVRRYLKIEMM
jgi:hypothetical protein